mgnify:FL=1
MTKKELIGLIAESTESTQKSVDGFLNAFIEIVGEELSAGNEVRLVGFGTFKVIHKKARKGINPKTLKAIDIPATKTPKFVAGKTLKDRIEK